MGGDIMSVEHIVNTNFNGDFEIVIIHRIENGHEVIHPIVEDGVKWETEIEGSPGKLTFKMYKDNNDQVNVQEGDSVTLFFYTDGIIDEAHQIAIFVGYIFAKSRSKDGWIEITAYDQLRYFKNKATYTYTNKKASDVVKMIAEDYKLKLGQIEETNYVIGSRVEDDQTLFDIAQNALDLTWVGSGTRYVLYSHNNALYLKDLSKQKLDLVINESTAENYEYKSTIDEEVYNEIELFYDNDETNKREYFHAESQANISKWGRLRLTESIQNPANAQDRANKLLTLNNRVYRELKVKGAFGYWECRAGTMVIVNLKLGDIEVNTHMVVEKATHTFKHKEYRMDLTLSNKEFAI
jgi:hypothetical protein